MSDNNKASRRLSMLLGHLTGSRQPRSTLTPNPVSSGTFDPLLARSDEGFAAMVKDRRISAIDHSVEPLPKRETAVGLRDVRFSQSSISSGFSAPPPGVNVPIAVRLRSLNPLSVLTEGAGSGGSGAPRANMVRNENESSLTTFDHRRLVNMGLHAPDAPVEARIHDKALVPKREWGKYSTQSMGESIAVLDMTNKKRSFGNLSIKHGPDPELKKNTKSALTHMMNRQAVFEELTAKKSGPEQIRDNAKHASQKLEYQTRLNTFSQKWK